MVLLKSARSPVAVFLWPVVLLKRANVPLAVFWKPVVLLKSAPAPVAVFPSAVLLRSVPASTPVQTLPSVRLRRENIPTAELYKPVVTLPRASCPSAVLPPGKAVFGAAGSTACAFGKRPRQKSASVIRSNGVALLSSIVDVIIMVLSLFPAADSLIAGLKRAKNRTGRGFLGPSQTYLRRVLRNPR